MDAVSVALIGKVLKGIEGSDPISALLATSLVGKDYVDHLQIASVNGVVGKFLRILIGPDFEPYKNIATLDELLQNENAMEVVVASEAGALTLMSSLTALSSIVNNSDIMQAIIDYATNTNNIINVVNALTAVANSSTAMNVVASHNPTIDILLNSDTAMSILVEDATAMNVLAASSYFRTHIKDATYWWNTIRGSDQFSGLDMPYGKMIAAAAGLNPADYADTTAVVSSSTAMSYVTTSLEALRLLVLHSRRAYYLAVAQSVARAALLDGTLGRTFYLGSPWVINHVWNNATYSSEVWNRFTNISSVTKATSSPAGGTYVRTSGTTFDTTITTPIDWTYITELSLQRYASASHSTVGVDVYIGSTLIGSFRNFSGWVRTTFNVSNYTGVQDLRLRLTGADTSAARTVAVADIALTLAS